MLPISLDDLIHARSIESTRLEFKKTWDEFTRLAVLETICAFANDFQNLNGGYVVLGIEESTESAGRPVLPPVGLDEQNLDEIQKQIRGECKKIDPEYQPVLEPVIFQDRQILVIWAPPGDARPYQAPAKRAPKDRKYFVRIGSSTVDAQGDLRNQLFGQTARIPFDDRRRMDVPISAISGELVRRFLTDVQSDLGSSGAWDETRDLLRALRLTARSNGDEYPKNVALLFFTEDPDSYFPGARIEVAQFGDGAGGDLIEEKDFRGPLDRQLRRVLEYLDSLSANLTRKVPGRAEAIRLVAFPYEALEESLANALLHRSYEGPPEPIKVYLYPDRMEITSYPGPVPGLTLQDLLPGARPNPVPMRNRRIGDFLKELRLAEMRGTGIPTIRRRMRENGSPEPQFVFDEQRTYFRVILPAHPEYIVLHGLREAGALWAVGEKERAIQNLDLARQQAPHAGSLAAQLIDYCSEQGDVARAERVFHEFIGRSEATAVELAYFAMARAYLRSDDPMGAQRILQRIPTGSGAPESVELAILHKRAGQWEDAHQVFASVESELRNDARGLHEYAQTKVKLASKLPKTMGLKRDRLNREAAEMLRQVVRLNDSPTRTAWAWFDLAKTLESLRAPASEIEQACVKAIELLPTEQRFQDWRAFRNADPGHE